MTSLILTQKGQTCDPIRLQLNISKTSWLAI